MKEIILGVFLAGALVAQSDARTVYLQNFADAGTSARPITTDAGALLPGGTGAVSIGAFRTLTDVQITAFGAAGRDLLLADFIPFADSVVSPTRVGDANAFNIPGLYSDTLTGILAAGNPLIGKPTYTFIGNAATLATSTQIAVVRDNDYFALDDQPIIAANAFLHDLPSQTVLIGFGGPATGVPGLGTFPSLRLVRVGGSPNLIAWWNFDSPVVGDYSFDTHAGIPAQLRLGAAPTAAGGGRAGTGADHGMNFGTAGQHLYVSNASFLNETGLRNEVSISFWQKLHAVRAQTTLFANSANIVRALSTHTPWSDFTLYFDTAGCCDGTQRLEGLPPGPVTWTGQWNHVVLIKAADSKEIWVNGVRGPSGSNTAPLPTDFTELFIGNSSNLVEAVDGSLDDLAVFAGALDATQIARLAGGAAPTAILDPVSSFAITHAAYDTATHTFQLTWTSTAGAIYTLEGSTSLGAATWVKINDNIQSGGATTALSYDVDLFPPGGATPRQLYLRVRQAP